MPFEIHLLKADFEHLAPFTLLVLGATVLAQHLLSAFVESKIHKASERERHQHEAAFELLRHQHRQSAMVYQSWVSRLFDANILLFSRLSELRQSLISYSTEEQAFKSYSRSEIEQCLGASYPDSQELRNSLAFWHSDRERCLRELDRYLRPIRVERARLALRRIDEACLEHQLFLSDSVLRMVRELVTDTAAFLADSTRSDSSTGQELDWFNARVVELRKAIKRELSDERGQVSKLPAEKKRWLSRLALPAVFGRRTRRLNSPVETLQR